MISRGESKEYGTGSITWDRDRKKYPPVLSPGLRGLKVLARERFQQIRLQYRDIKTLVYPAEIGLLVFAVSPFQEDKEENIMGLRNLWLLTKTVAPTRWPKGCQSQGSGGWRTWELFETPKGIYLASKKKKSRTTGPDVLSELLPQLITGIAIS